MNVRLLVISLMLLTVGALKAQEKEYLWEIGAQGGASWTYGDRNPNRVMSDVGASYGLVARYNATLRWSFAGELNSDAARPNRLWSLSVRPEFSFWNYGWGNDYRDKRRYAPFMTLGLTAGMLTGNESDRGFVFGIPIGVGLKYKIAQRWNMQVTALFTKTFSDKVDGIDNVGGIKQSAVVGNDWMAGIRIGITYDFKERCIECHNQRN